MNVTGNLDTSTGNFWFIKVNITDGSRINKDNEWQVGWLLNQSTSDLPTNSDELIALARTNGHSQQASMTFTPGEDFNWTNSSSPEDSFSWSNKMFLFGTSNSIPNDSLYSLGKADNDGSIEFKITSTSECIIGISDKNTDYWQVNRFGSGDLSNFGYIGEPDSSPIWWYEKAPDYWAYDDSDNTIILGTTYAPNHFILIKIDLQRNEQENEQGNPDSGIGRYVTPPNGNWGDPYSPTVNNAEDLINYWTSATNATSAYTFIKGGDFSVFYQSVEDLINDSNYETFG